MLAPVAAGIGGLAGSGPVAPIMVVGHDGMAGIDDDADVAGARRVVGALEEDEIARLDLRLRNGDASLARALGVREGLGMIRVEVDARGVEALHDVAHAVPGAAAR